MLTSEAKRRLFWVSCIFLLLFRAKWAFKPAWTSDDGCYLEFLYRWVGLLSPEACTTQPNPVAIGAPLLWLLPAAVCRAIAYFVGASPDAGLIPVLALVSFAFWGCGFAFLDAALATASGVVGLGEGKIRTRWTLVFALTVPVLYYGIQRPMMSHTAEFALSMALLYFLRKGKLASAAVSALLLTLTRYNDAPALLLPLAAWGERAGMFRFGGKKTSALRAAFAVAAAASVGIFAWLALFHGYAGFTLMGLWDGYSIENTLGALFGLDFGLLWTAVPWLVSLGLGAARFHRLSWMGRAAWAWLAAEAVLVCGWSGNGSDFGHRYLIGSYAANFLITIEILETETLPKIASRIIRGVTAAQAIVLTAFLVAFKSLPETGMGDSVIVALLRAPFAPKFFKVVLVQQFPLMTIFISLFWSDRPGYSLYTVTGPGLFLLGLATVGALAGVLQPFFSDGFTG